MKRAKLKKQMLQAKEVHGRKITALKKLSEGVAIAKDDFARSKEELKAARKQHKEAKKHLRELQKSQKHRQADQKEAQQSLIRLEKKWRKVSKSSTSGTHDRKRKRGRVKHSKPSNTIISPEIIVAGN